MSEQDAALVERVAESIRPLHDRPAHNGEYLSKTDIHQYAREVIAAVRGEGLEALLERHGIYSINLIQNEDKTEYLALVKMHTGKTKWPEDGLAKGPSRGEAIRAAVEAALGEGE